MIGEIDGVKIIATPEQYKKCKKSLEEQLEEKDKEIERLKRLLSIEKEYREKFDKDNQILYKIINETREILKFHLSNPSQTINGWHIDIWNSKDIEKLNKMLEIIEVKEENNG